MGDDNYLKDELYHRVRTDPAIFEFLQAGSLDGIWYWDLEDGGNEWMSPRFWETFGHDPSGKTHHASEWQGMIHPDDLETALANAKLHFENPDHPYDQVVRYQHKDGSTVWVRCRGLAVRDEDGKPVRMLGAHNEITALKETEAALALRLAELEATQQQLEAKNAELARSNERLTSFAHVASHDLQEPLRVIRQFGDLLGARKADLLDAEAHAWLGFMTDGADRMRALVQGLLEWSKVGESGTACVEVDLDGLMAVVRQDLAAAIEEAHAELVTSSLPPIHGDASQLRQLMQNLVGNAIKYRQDGVAPRVEIAAAEDAAGWTLTVADNGIGIPERYQDRIFAPFQRLHPRSRFKGSGIGLAICQRIVEEHRGRIAVESAGEGTGTTFSVWLPRPAA